MAFYFLRMELKKEILIMYYLNLVLFLNLAKTLINLLFKFSKCKKKKEQKLDEEKAKELVNYLNAKIMKIMRLIRKGYDAKKIKSDRKLRLKEKTFNFLGREIKITKDDLIELARGRIKAKKQGKGLQKLFVFYKELPFACNENIAKLRAKLLKNYLINKEFADLSCGFGIQSLYFLKYAKKAYLFEINLKKLFFAYLNSVVLNVSDKVEFFNADSNKLEGFVKELVKNLDFIYSDPGRGLNEKRDFNSLTPNPLILLKYNINYLFDLPPQMKKELIERELGNVSLEYIEFNGEINRLMVYSPSIKKKWGLADRRAIISENKIFEGKKKELDLTYYKGEKFLVEPFPSLVYSELLSFPIIMEKRRFFIPTNELNKGFKEIGKNIYKVVEKDNSLKDLARKIKKYKRLNQKARVVLRINMEDKDYYKLKKEIEEELNGNISQGEKVKKEKNKLFI
jgi:16S rRNA G966 N2-methylase RsmD